MLILLLFIAIMLMMIMSVVVTLTADKLIIIAYWIFAIMIAVIAAAGKKAINASKLKNEADEYYKAKYMDAEAYFKSRCSEADEYFGYKGENAEALGKKVSELKSEACALEKSIESFHEQLDPLFPEALVKMVNIDAYEGLKSDEEKIN